MNGTAYLFIPTEDHWELTAILAPSENSVSRPYGDTVDIKIEADLSLWYNTLRYAGIITIDGAEYKFNDSEFIARSTVGKIYEGFKYAGTQKYIFYEIAVPILESRYRTTVYFTDSSCHLQLTDIETYEILSTYSIRKSFNAKKQPGGIHLPLTE